FSLTRGCKYGSIYVAAERARIAGTKNIRHPHINYNLIKEWAD
ncbi:hypothetical protein LCGC14_2634710, partial [marine sediment metagenome]